MDISIYLHYPFCRHKCLYCSFNSTSELPCSPADYVDGLVKEMHLRSRELKGNFTAKTLYIGGGTPSLLEPLQVRHLIALTREIFYLIPEAEITLECNPGSLSFDKLTSFRHAGVNRLSIGVQSFEDQILNGLGRTHSSAQAIEVFTAARDAGFDNVGIDLMHSVPDQALESWEQDLRRACELNPEHLSVYGLTVEEGTPFAALEREGNLSLPDDELSAIMYEKAARILTDWGYEHYEIANFAKPGFRSTHNCGYWQRRSYLGIGAGAHSFIRTPGYGKRFSNIASPEDYLRHLTDALAPTESEASLSKREAMAEWVFLGLRMADGVHVEHFREEFGVPFGDIFGATCMDLLSKGFLEMNDSWLRLIPKAFVVSNQIFLKFL